MAITAFSFAQTQKATKLLLSDTSGSVETSAALEIEATDKALLLSRVANTGAIATPVNGMTVYAIDEKCFKGYADGAWIDVSTCTPVPAGYTVASPTYQGTSVINATGIGYNGEAVPAASTITVEATVTTPGAYTLTATDATTGLEYSASGTFAAAGAESVVLTPNTAVMPEFFSGVIIMDLMAEGVDSTVDLEPRIDIKSIGAAATAVRPVDLGNGQIFMDRNLGARRVATAIDDVFSYGDHYQWGRFADGHEISVWNGTSKTAGRGLADATALEALATSDFPGHANFILTNVAPFDWRDDNNVNRWETANQGPCPTGYHVPTNTEWNTADTFGAWANNTDTFNSALKLPSSGYRTRTNGTLDNQGTYGYYWASTVSGTNARYLSFLSTAAHTLSLNRAHGLTVRCLKD